jgi:hypothetical protein
MEGLKTPMSMIWLVIKSRTDGMGLNAATRTFAVAKNTILSWERKLSDLHRVRFLYTLIHQFIEVVIEGDEAYTQVHPNVPPHESSGWTILLMDRARRFVLALDCGPQDRKALQRNAEYKSYVALYRQTCSGNRLSPTSQQQTQFVLS